VQAPHLVYAPVRVTAEERESALKAWSTRLRTIGTEQPIEVGQYWSPNNQLFKNPWKGLPFKPFHFHSAHQSELFVFKSMENAGVH
jgi:hypothetical protein